MTSRLVYRTPSGELRTSQHSRDSVKDERITSGVSETVWLQPTSRDHDVAGRHRPNTLALPNKIIWTPRLVDELAATAKSPDLKALIKYVGHHQQQDPSSHSAGHSIALQCCVRDATRRMTYFINAVNAVPDVVVPPSASPSTSRSPSAGTASGTGGSSTWNDPPDNEDDDGGEDYGNDPNERRRRRRRRQVRVIAAAGLHRRLRAQCRTVSDDVLPALVDALRAAMWPPSADANSAGSFDDFESVRTQLVLVEETIGSLQPCVQMVLVARRLLDEIDDVELVANLTSLVLAVAESLSRMRLAAARSLVELPFSADDRSPYDNHLLHFRSSTDDVDPTGGNDVRGCDGGGNEMALEMYRDAGMAFGLPLASMEICDAAYRQIQQAGTALECCYWPPVNDDDHLANLLATIVNNCYEVGSSMEAISKSAECRQMASFHQSVRQFADAVSRVMVTAAQIGLTRRRLLMSAKALRHCACSLVTSARLLACDGQHPGSHGAFSAHSRALSRALTELVNCLSSMYVRAP